MLHCSPELALAAVEILGLAVQSPSVQGKLVAVLTNTKVRSLLSGDQIAEDVCTLSSVDVAFAVFLIEMPLLLWVFCLYREMLNECCTALWSDWKRRTARKKWTKQVWYCFCSVRSQFFGSWCGE